MSIEEMKGVYGSNTLKEEEKLGNWRWLAPG